MIEYKKIWIAIFIATLGVLTYSEPLFAQDVSTIADNTADSIESLPGLVSALAYLLGLIFGVRGVFKLKAHVENPGEGSGQTPLKSSLIHFAVGGMLFSLPIVFQAMLNTIGGSSGLFATGLPDYNNLFTGIQSLSTGNINISTVLANIIISIRSVPGLLTAVSYLLGLVIGVNAILKLREYVEEPAQTKINEPIIRFVVAGALFALPTIFGAMYETIAGDPKLGIITFILDFIGGGNYLSSDFGAGASVVCNASNATTSSTIGQSVCGIVTNIGAFPAFLTAISYLFGIWLAIWGILKLRDHVLTPQQVNIFEGVSRLFAGGAFFALPFMVDVLTNTIAGGISVGATTTGFNENINGVLAGLSSGGCPTSVGLDVMLVCFASDLLGPVHTLLNFFAFIVGMIFIMIGISRLIKGAQDGTKSAVGLGTMMTFVIGGALIAYNELVSAITSTLTGSSTTTTNATMAYVEGAGITDPERAAFYSVVSSIIKFMIIVGLISFVRGLFIVRDVAEGSQQASMMAAVTHIVGGALAINLGPLLNAVQATLGIGAYGITFS